jgi:hypothetical protein
MINSREVLVAEMKDLEGIIAMYKEAFPDNPAFAKGDKKQKQGKKAAGKQEQIAATTTATQPEEQ